MHNFRDLTVWNRALELVEEVYGLTKRLPSSEKGNFVHQINRSALSIPSNIAEGAGRNTDKDFCRFLDIALGSSYELETQLILVERIFKIDTNNIVNKTREIQKMAYSLKKSKSN